MSEIPMMHPVSKETVDHYALNAGAMMKNVVFEGITGVVPSFCPFLQLTVVKISPFSIIALDYLKKLNYNSIKE